MRIDFQNIAEKSLDNPERVTSVNSKKSFPILNKNFTLINNRSKFKQSFFSELYVLLHSGLDLRFSLDIIIDSQPRDQEKDIIKKIQNNVINGKSFSEALLSQNQFSQYDIQSLKIGEESGFLDIVLKDLSEYYSRRISQQRQLKSALSYPILVLTTTLISLGFMLGYIVPMFEDVFSKFNSELPGLTKSIIKLSQFVIINTKYLLLSLLVITSLIIYLRRKDWVREYSSKVLLRTPIIGKIILLSNYVRFCQAMKLLSSSKVHLVDSISLIRKMISFFPLEEALTKVEQEIVNGIPLSKAMDNTGFFEKKMIALTRVGEEVNKLESVYQELLNQYSEDQDARVKSMNSLLEPIMIIIVGCIVGLILVSMYLPIFKIGTAVM